MVSRRDFLSKSIGVSALGVIGAPLIGCTTAKAAPAAPFKAAPARRVAARRSLVLAQADVVPSVGMAPPPDIFDAQALDLEFWLKPRTLTMIRPQSGERASVLYWKDGEVIDSAYQQLCHLMRDVNGKETAPIDPKLFETLWGTQAFIARYGMEAPLEILSGYRTSKSNRKLIEQGIPAARQSLHIEGKAADIRIPNLNAEVLGGLVRSFRQGGVGFYYRENAGGGWIHADTGLQRTWKG
ncbi:YcbK family protein [Massilia sp. TSP1-1-2]|uniref:YcbK family protein n=1 Tax=Massilia sp. TSP1-1-2 TaxID=2804649 RepID=UPI003CEB3061